MSSPVAPIRRIRDESIVTGEAVELEIHPASPHLRVAAGLVDVYITIIVMFITSFFLQSSLEFASDSVKRILQVGLFVTFMVLIPATVEFLTRGRSLGKWAFGIQVVRDDGGIITARHIFTRWITAILEIWLALGSIATISTFVSPMGKRLGDLAAGTMVIRLPEAIPHPPLLMPPGLEYWATTAHILPLPVDLHMEALAFLRANRSLVPHVREAGAVSIAERIAHRVSPPPPEGTHPERFIAAVLVILRDREWGKIRQQDEQGKIRRQSAHAHTWGI
ncbi:MAG: RDD family protein [Actinomycetaceae bacterium]|nr:RDD family protein [Actinomycetaceae bacterium]